MIRVLLFIFLFTTTLQGQEYSISGKITNAKNSSLSYVNVVLLKQVDSIIVRGTSTDEKGLFDFSNVNRGGYILKASFIGYKDFYLDLNVDNTLDLGTLVLKEASEFLDEITLEVQKPTVQIEIDRLIFNVENTTLSSGNTWDILSKTPGVIIQQNSISIRNQPATVYINDRKVNLSPAELKNLLESYSGNNIKSIEVITNPSAKYDADSGMILNIVTNKNIIPGYKGNISGGYTQAIFSKYRAGTAHYFKNDWVNIALDYSLNKRKEHKNDLGEIAFFDSQNGIENFWDVDFERVTRSTLHNINTAIDFTLSQRSNIDIAASIFLDPNTTYENKEVTEILDSMRNLDSFFTTNSYLDIIKHNIALDATFTQILNNNGATLKANVHYTNFDHKREQHLASAYFLPNESLISTSAFETDSHQEINIYIGQLDFSSSLLGMNFDAGIKGSKIESKSGMSFFDIVNNTATLNTELSDSFMYDETILSGYVSFAKSWEKWRMRAGLRGEYTETEGNSIAMDEISKKDYLEWFPSITLNFTPNQNHSIGAAFNRSISRPRYDLLNPFRYFINENNFTSGNPHLVPAIRERYSLNYLAEGKYYFEFYYNSTKDDIEVLSFQNNEEQFLRSVSSNMVQRRGYGLNFQYATSLNSWWYFSNNFSLFHMENTFIAVESNNEEVTLGNNGMFIQMYNQYTLSKDKTLTADLTFSHLTGLVLGTYLMDSYTTVSIGVRKSLWNNRASLSLLANDIFDTTNRKLSADFLNQRNSYFAIQEMQYIQLGFVYNFGNFSLRDSSRQIRNEERTRIDQ